MAKKTILDIPAEVLVMVLKNLELKYVIETCSRVCHNWRQLAVKCFLEPHVKKLAKLDNSFRESYDELWNNEFDWNGETNDVNSMLKIYHNMKCYQSK